MCNIFSFYHPTKLLVSKVVFRYGEGFHFIVLDPSPSSLRHSNNTTCLSVYPNV